MKPRIEYHNLDGQGARKTHVYDLPPGPQIKVGGKTWDTAPREYWPAVTDVPCPTDPCDGVIRWAEAGYVPGYRICDKCGRHFMARGTADKPNLVRVHDRRGGFYFKNLSAARKETTSA